jgi:hypothetical protein
LVPLTHHPAASTFDMVPSVTARVAGAREKSMAVGPFKPVAGFAGMGAARKKPGHFVALTEYGRIDAVLAQNGVKLADALEKRASIPVTNAQRGLSEGGMLSPAIGVSAIGPYEVTIAMAAPDGEPVVSAMDRETWSKFRVVYEVNLEADPYVVSGLVLLLPSQDPFALMERGSELFLAVFSPSVYVNGAALWDTPGDALLLNRSHIKRVTSSQMR